MSSEVVWLVWILLVMDRVQTRPPLLSHATLYVLTQCSAWYQQNRSWLGLDRFCFCDYRAWSCVSSLGVLPWRTYRVDDHRLRLCDIWPRRISSVLTLAWRYRVHLTWSGSCDRWSGITETPDISQRYPLIHLRWSDWIVSYLFMIIQNVLFQKSTKNFCFPVSFLYLYQLNSLNHKNSTSSQTVRDF